MKTPGGGSSAMEISVSLVRNGMTRAGESGRYIGVTDEPLSPAGAEQLAKKKRESAYPPVDCVFTASARRCLETAPIVYPGQPAVVAGGFCAFDYGAFEGKSYREMEQTPEFKEWALGLKEPGRGQDFHAMTYRNIGVFREIMGECVRKDLTRIAVVTHRLAILAILRSYCVPRPAYRGISVDFGGGMTILYDNYRDSAKIVKLF